MQVRNRRFHQLRVLQVATACRLAVGFALIATLTACTAGATCLPCSSDAFEDGTLSALWTVEGSCGSATETGGAFAFSKATCVGFVLARFSSGSVLCGDFAIELDYSLSFPAPSAAGGSIHGVQLLRADTNALVGGIERYRQGTSSCVWPIADSYKSYTSVPGCPPDAIYAETSDTSGRFRIARTGSDLVTSYWNAGWVQQMSRTVTTTDLFLRLHSGTNGSLSTAHTGTFDNFSLTVSSPPCTVPVRGALWSAVKALYRDV